MISIDVSATQNLRARELESELLDGNVSVAIKMTDGSYNMGKFESVGLDVDGDYVIKVSM